MIHVAVLLKPYLDLILAGEKAIECRLTRQPRAPYEQIEPGERIWFKQSAGPWGATAVAEHVLFEANLTPRKIKELQRNYNHQIRGDQQFWDWKADSRYCTLIWLTDVKPTQVGPRIGPLQGQAWLVLPESAARPALPAATGRGEAAGGSFSIEITAGNIRNNTLYVTTMLERFPPRALGGKTRTKSGRQMTLMLHGGPTVQSDIVESRKMFRTRCWGPWFRKLDAEPGDRVVFTPIDEETFVVRLRRRRGGN